MKNITQLVLMLCLILSGALCYAHGEARTGEMKKEGINIEVKEAASYSGLDRSNSITLVLNGNYLSVTFTENLGQVAIALTTVSDVPVESLSALTPTGLMIYIPLAGDYIVTFTLPNGDEYYGEFTVTN